MTVLESDKLKWIVGEKLGIINRIATTHDVNVIADLHRLALDVGLLARAPKFVLVDFHRRIVKSNHCLTLLAIDRTGKVVGFCSILPSNRSSHILGSPRIFFGSLLAVILRPDYIGVLIHNFHQYRTGPQRSGLEIVALGVSPNNRGQGLGGDLIEAALTRAAKENSIEVYTKTHNGRLANFYKSRFGARSVSYKDLGPYEEFVLTFVFKIAKA